MGKVAKLHGKLPSKTQTLLKTPVNNAIRDYWYGNDVVPSRCDPTPISLAGGVLSAAGAFNLSCSFLPILRPLRRVVSPGFGISYANPTPQLRGSLGAVWAGIRGSSGTVDFSTL